MKINRLTALALCASMLSGMTACGSGQTAKADNSANKLKIVCTIFPEYDWVKQLLGDHAAEAELTYLLDSGMDLHSYQPTATVPPNHENKQLLLCKV